MEAEKTYRIGEVAKMLDLNTSVLRFWETEFPQIAPLHTEKGQRIYTEKHVRLLREVRRLLYEEGMTIKGVRRVLAASPGQDESAAEKIARAPDPDLIGMIKHELAEIALLLANPQKK